MQEDTYEMHALLSKFTTVIIIIKFDRVTGFITKYKKNTTNLYNKKKKSSSNSTPLYNTAS